MASLYYHKLRGKIQKHKEKKIEVDDYILDKVFDKIKEIIGIKKFDDTKIICQIIQGFDLTFQK